MANDRGIEFLLCDCALMWRKLYTKFTQDLNLVGLERRIILILFAHPLITQIDLAYRLEVDSQNLTRVLDRMEAKGTIEKQTSPSDRRAKCLQLTSDGKAIYKEILKIADKIRPDIFKGIKKTDIKIVEATLTLIKSNIEDNLKQ